MFPVLLELSKQLGHNILLLTKEDMLMNIIIYKIVAVREESKPWDFTFVLRMTSPSDASFSVFLLVAKFVCDTHDSFDVDLYCGCFTLRRNTS